MEKVKEYTVVGGRTGEDFVKEVQKMVNLGWQPFGSLSTVWGKRTIPNSRPAVVEEIIYYAQALVKY